MIGRSLRSSIASKWKTHLFEHNLLAPDAVPHHIIFRGDYALSSETHAWFAPIAIKQARQRSALIALVVIPITAFAGPPFITDDPEPVELDNWEVYLGTIDQRTSAGCTGTAPLIEVNYGAFPDLQLHAIVPIAYTEPLEVPRHAGLGDIELGAKWRFVQESDTLPQIGIFPLLEVPTGDVQRGLGSGYDQVFLPMWIQKTEGSWTAYGGGGYWINPGSGNRNY